MKNNTEVIDSALEKILRLKPKRFEYRNDGIYSKMRLPEGTHFGFIAQEIEEIFPELVRGQRFVSDTNEEINYKSVTMVEIIPILVKAMKEQQQIIDKLSKEIENLKESITEGKTGEDSK